MKKAILLVTTVLLIAAALVIARQFQNRSQKQLQRANTAQAPEPVAIQSRDTDSSHDEDPRTRLYGSAPIPPKVEIADVNDRRRFRSGQLVAYEEKDHLDMQVGTQQYRVDFSQLPVSINDCEDVSDIQVCVRGVNIAAFDEIRGRVLLVVPAGTSKNPPQVLAGYDLQTRQIARYGIDFTAGLGEIAISESGRYIAYLAYWTCGVCCTGSGVRVIDLEERKIAAVPHPEFPDKLDRITASKIRWIGNSEFEYESEASSLAECNLPFESRELQAVTTNISLSRLEFK